MDTTRTAIQTFAVEVSGWDRADNFFVETTELDWNDDGSRRVLLRRPIRKKTLLFIRLIDNLHGPGTMPVAYSAEGIGISEAGEGQEVLVVQLHPQPIKLQKPSDAKPGNNDKHT